MSKSEVLEQIYPDEVQGILKKANIERARQRQKELTGYFYTLMAPVLPWMQDNNRLQGDLIKNITEEIQRIHDYLKGQDNKKEETGGLNQQPQKDPFGQLEELQKVIAGTRARMDPGKVR